MALWLDNPRKRRRSKKHRGRRHNPFLAEYMFGNPRRRRARTRGSHRRHRRNPAAALGMGALRNPMPFLQEGLFATAGAYSAVTVGNLLANTIMPAQTAGEDWTSRLLRYGSRGVAAWGLDMAVGRSLGESNRRAFRLGTVVGIVGSAIFDLLARPFILGPGDQAFGPAYAFTGLAGTGAYARTRMLENTGAYTRVKVPGTALQGTQRLSKQSGWGM